MKGKIYLLFFYLFFTSVIRAQSVSINTDGAAAHASALLDIQSDSKGLLVPRMTEAQKGSILAPATGLMIYQTDGLSGFYYFTGNSWTNVASGLSFADGGAAYDFLTKSPVTGEINYRKGHGAVGVNYIIALQGTFPPQIGPATYGTVVLGEIRLFAGSFAPVGWAFCQGQLLTINQNQALFSLLGTTFGGNGQTTFALPDLRGATPVQPGTSTANYSWAPGQRSN